jgi:hypothetical protein
MPVEVELGENKEVKPFASASKSGSIINAYNALKMAEKMSAKAPKAKMKN